MFIIKWLVIWFVVAVLVLIVLAVAAGRLGSCKARRPTTWACATAS